jgi:uncharacterized membrane protein
MVHMGSDGAHVVYLIAGGLIVAGLLRLVFVYRRARRLVGSGDDPERRRGRRTLDLVAGGYAVVLLVGLAVGLLAHSVAWGIGVVVALSVLAMLVVVVILVVAGVRGDRSSTR